MAEKDDKNDDGPITFRHIRDGREITVQSNHTKILAEYEAHKNWKRA